MGAALGGGLKIRSVHAIIKPKDWWLRKLLQIRNLVAGTCRTTWIKPKVVQGSCRQGKDLVHHPISCWEIQELFLSVSLSGGCETFSKQFYQNQRAQISHYASDSPFRN